MLAPFRTPALLLLSMVLVACSGREPGFENDGSLDGDAHAISGDGFDRASIDSTVDGSSLDAARLPDGSVQLDDGTWLLPDGAHVYPDGAIVPGSDAGDLDVATLPGDGSMYFPPDGSIMRGDGGWVLADGAPWVPICPSLADGGPSCGTTETCGNGLDDDCDGLVDEGCPCQPGVDRERCFDGCPTQAGVGVCDWGVMMCPGMGEFGSYDGRCIGAGRPQPVRCGGLRDYLCDGIIDEGCSCRSGETRPCYTGPASTRNIGACQDGTQRCASMDGGTGWGPCIGEVLPSAPACDGIDHACDGMPFEGCACMPGAARPCYDGPAGTSGVGLCRPGTQSCSVTAGVASWGTCVGQVLPAPNRCDGVDRACTGMPDIGCSCTAGAVRSCYTGPAGTDGVGLCRAGMQTCADAGIGPRWGSCVGQVLPAPDTCDGLDHNCDGTVDTGCVCPPGTTRRCYDGPPATEGVGACQAGTQNCIRGPGGVGSSWSPCTGQVVPGSITCDGIDHACDGNYSADCPCITGASRPCYTGPAGTAGVGTCRAGSQQCVARTGGGTGWGACGGQVLPSAPSCDGLDHACTGTLPDCNPAVTCPAPVTTGVGAGVLLRGVATAIAPATIVSYVWSIISAPAGATAAFSSTTTNPTTFSANNAGVYTVRLTVTDSMGRSSSCSVLVTVTSRSYLGTEFWAVSTTNSQLMAGNTFQFAIAIGNPNATAVSVTVTGGALAAPLTFSVPSNNTVTQTLPWVDGLAHNSGSTRGFIPSTSSLVSSGAYRISTSAPVSAYQFNPLTFTTGGGRPVYSYSNDASLLLPTVALTGNYIALAHNAFYADGSFVAIVGTSATPTTVTVMLSSPITAGPGVTAAASGATVTYTLNRGDVVQLISTYMNPPTCSPALMNCAFLPQDMTGSIITASQPVAVFGGSDCTQMSYPTGTVPACDHIEQQIFPIETWGRDVIVSQLQDRGTSERYMVRVLSRENANTISFTPTSAHAPVTLNRGQFVEFESAADFEITSTQPILVAQYMEGQDTTPGATVGDPSFVLEVPAPQYRTDYNFVVPGSYTSSFINVVGRTGASILLDGTALPATSRAIAGTVWSVWRLPIAPGSHRINTAGASGFGLKVLGVAPYTSYTYPGGLDLRTLP